MSSKPDFLTPEASSPSAAAKEPIGSDEALHETSQKSSELTDEAGRTALNPDGAYDHLTLLQQLYIHWDKMRQQYWQEDRYEESVAMAERMLREQELPLYFRAQCYLTLASFDITAADAGTHAATAVSILDDMKAAGAPIPDSAYKLACDVLAEAEELEGLFDDEEDTQDDPETVAPTREPTPEVTAESGAEFTPLRDQLRPRTRSAMQREQAMGPATPAMSPVRKKSAGEE